MASNVYIVVWKAGRNEILIQISFVINILITYVDSVLYCMSRGFSERNLQSTRIGESITGQRKQIQFFGGCTQIRSIVRQFAGFPSIF